MKITPGCIGFTAGGKKDIGLSDEKSITRKRW